MKLLSATIYFGLFLSCHSCYLNPFFEKFLGLFPEFNLSTAYLSSPQIISKNDYPSEAYTIQTEDGYYLQLHRIPHGRVKTPGKRIPVLMQHGFQGSSLNFLHLAPNRSLAFILADLGFDVWLGNFRGNTYSNAHTRYTPCDTEFWEYTWEESGMYDLPAMIDLILSKTEHDKLHYIGYSMGTTAFFVMLSMRPEYNRKIIQGQMLAPVIFLNHLKFPLVKLIAPFLDEISVLAKVFTTGALLSRAWKALVQLACQGTFLGKKLCKSVFHHILDVHYDDIDRNLMGPIVYNYPAGYSIKALHHFAQLLLSGEFRRYDHGIAENLKLYGTPKPPSYVLSRINAPIVLHVAQKDHLSTLPDAKKLMQYVNCIIDVNIVGSPKFNHLDFLMGRKVKEMLYDKVVKYML